MTAASATERLETLRQEISPQVELLVVSKKQPAETLMPLLQAGHRLFGENRVQEAAEKWPPLLAKFHDCKLHLIGRLQTNKVIKALAIFDTIHSVDRAALVETLAQHRELFRPNFYLLLQVNLADDAQRAGIAPTELASFIGVCKMQHLPVKGLMTMPPPDVDPEPYFKQLKALADKHALPEISMGMSADYRQAIACGSTIIRVGRALFADSPEP